MSEMEQLQKQAQEQYVKERHQDVATYFNALIEKVEDRDRWHERAASLTFYVMMFHLGSLIWMLWWGVSQDTIDLITEFSFLLFLIAMMREWILHSQYQRAVGEFFGCVTTLRKLGMLKDVPEEGEKRPRKRKSMFARYKEFFERMGSKNKQEVAVPA